LNSNGLDSTWPNAKLETVLLGAGYCRVLTLEQLKCVLRKGSDLKQAPRFDIEVQFDQATFETCVDSMSTALSYLKSLIPVAEKSSASTANSEDFEPEVKFADIEMTDMLGAFYN
jgi:hypothetical protein